MKQLTFCLILFLSGCGLTGGLTTAKQFDSNEYNNIIHIHVVSQRAYESCNTPAQIVPMLFYWQTQIDRAKLFIKHSNNRPLETPMQLYHDNFTEFAARYTAGEYPSTRYCEIKVTGLMAMSEEIMKVTGRSRK
jgi:hypothetical protein